MRTIRNANFLDETVEVASTRFVRCTFYNCSLWADEGENLEAGFSHCSMKLCTLDGPGWPDGLLQEFKRLGFSGIINWSNVN